MKTNLKDKRVRLIHMDDDYTQLRPGDEGTILFTDDRDQIHVNWDNGEHLALIPGVDEYTILN